MRNIVYFSFAELPSQAAHGVHIMKMCRAICRAGYNLVLIAHVKAAHQADIFQYYGIEKSFPIRSFPMPAVRMLGRCIYLVLAFFPLLKERGEIILYSRDLFSSVLACRFGIPVIYECHEIPERFLKKALLKAVLVHRNTKLLVCISTSMKRTLRRLNKEAGLDSKVMVAHDGVDLEAFDDLSQKDHVREAVGIPEDSHVIGYTGSLFKGRGVGIMVEAASRIKDSLFVVIGGYEKDVGSVAAEAALRGVNNLVLKGYVPNRLIPTYLMACDVLIMPYQHEVTLKGNKRNTVRYMSPLKMFEYMASGKPIVASKLEVLEEVLEHGRNAILVQPDDLDAWCDAIGLLKKDRSLAQKIGKQAQKDAKNFTWTARAAAILKRGASRPLEAAGR